MRIRIAGNITEKIYFIRHRNDFGPWLNMVFDFIKLGLAIECFRSLQMKNPIRPSKLSHGFSDSRLFDHISRFPKTRRVDKVYL